jgi:DNA repair protein RadC
MPSRPLRSAPPDRFADLAPHDLTPAETDSLIRLALAVLADRHRPGVALGSPEDTRAYLRLTLGDRRNEVFGCLFLDNRHRVRAMEELFQGTIDGATIHPREVLVAVLRHNAAAVVLFTTTLAAWPNRATPTRRSPGGCATCCPSSTSACSITS